MGKTTKHAPDRQRATRRSEPRQDRSAGENAISVTPPDYGMDFVDHDLADTPEPGTVVQPKLVALAGLANGQTVQRQLEEEEEPLQLKRERVPAVQRQTAGGDDGPPQGNSRIAVVREPVIQRTLQEDMHGQWTSALVELNSAYGGEAGVINRQKEAVRQFTADAAVPDPPSMTESIITGAITMLLGAALGGVGTLLKGVAGRMIQPALLGATRVTYGSAVDSADVRRMIRASVDGIIDKMIDAGKAGAATAVTAAWQGHGAGAGTSLLQFRETQLHAINAIARAQTAAMNGELARLAATEGEADEWAAANTLYAAFQASLSDVYDEQYNKTSDTWFTMQTRSIGLGARPGVLQIYLARRYPNTGDTFSITGGNLLGSGSVAAVRNRLARRKLEDIAIPKVIQMNGQMGYGIADCNWNIRVTGTRAPSSGPSFTAPTTSVQSLMAGPQRVSGVAGHHRWGLPWLAAYQLGLEDLDHDDERNTAANQWAGARKVWNAVKGSTPRTVGASSW